MDRNPIYLLLEMLLRFLHFHKVTFLITFFLILLKKNIYITEEAFRKLYEYGSKYKNGFAYFVFGRLHYHIYTAENIEVGNIMKNNIY